MKASPKRFTRRIVAAALCLLALGLVTGARAQGDSAESLRAEYEKLERESLSGHPNRRLSYIMLKPYLPPGTRMTSGYRTPEEQLDLIKRFARNLGMTVPPNVSVGDESSWAGLWHGIRARGIIIASPNTTPHGREEAVFDLAGADLDSINAGLLRAKEKGLITYRNIIIERKNNCVHVEVGLIDTKLLNNLTGLPIAPQAQTGGGGGGGATPAVVDEAGQKAELLRQMQRMHDGEPDPARRSDYDNDMIAMLDPGRDAARIRQLEAEVESHRAEAARVGGSAEQREAVEKISEALRDDRLKDAEREAIALTKKFPDLPDFRTMRDEIRARRLVVEATRLMDAASCGDCDRAGELVELALKLAPGHDGARLIKEDVGVCAERCRKRSVAVWTVSLLVLASLGGGLYFLALSKNWLPSKGAAAPPGGGGWVVEVLEGGGKGRVFESKKGSLVVGSKGPPEGEADVVVTDDGRRVSRRHCTLLREGGRLYVRDESTNGTKVNGRETGRGVLTECRAGDSITLGDAAVILLRRG
jgi:hypothetical protein